MNDKHRLSSEQALDDYFFDLLAEPEAPEPAEDPLPQGGDDQGDRVVNPEPVAVDVAVPFDFEQLSESSEEPDDVAIAVELNLSAPASQESGWVVQAPELKPETMPEYRLETEMAASFAEQPEAELEGVQRLLSQMSQIQPDIRQETPQAEVVTPTAEPVGEDTELAGTLDQSATDLLELEQAQLEQAELQQPVPEVAVVPETQPGGDQPPDLWQQQQDMGATFQALFFEVNGVTFAVPLTELGGIHQLGDVNRLLGRPPWYLGLMTNREHQLDVVDTARWVMPEKLSSDEHQQEYRYIVMLGESKWGLACHALHGTETLTEHSVRWREKAGKRPWLAGMVKEKMCALIHVNELISMLNAGLDVKSVI